MTDKTAFEEAEARLYALPRKEFDQIASCKWTVREWFFNAGRQAERVLHGTAANKSVPPEGTKGE